MENKIDQTLRVIIKNKGLSIEETIFKIKKTFEQIEKKTKTMEVEWKHIGGHGGRAANAIEVKVSNWGGNCSVSEDVTDRHGKVEIELINSLRRLADDLEEQNEKIEEQD